MNPERPWRLAALGAFAAAAAALAWAARANPGPPTFDEAWYLEVSYRFWHSLVEGGPAALARAWAGAFRFKAPFASAAPLPFYALFGLSYGTAVLSNVGALAVLSLSLYGLGRRLFTPAAAGLAAAAAVLMPLTAALSRTFFVETWLTAWTAAFLWRLAASDQLRTRRAPVELGLLFAAGLLTKVTFPGIVAGPLALTLWDRRRDPRGFDAAGLERAAKVFALCAGLPAATWYVPNLVTVTGFTLAGYRGHLSAAYGSTNAWAPSVVASYWSAIGREVLSWPAVLLALGLAAAARRRLRGPGFLFLAAWAVPYLLLTTSGYAKDQRYVAPAVPAFALFFGAVLDSATEGRRGRPLLCATAFLPLVYVFILQTFGVLPSSALIPERTQYGGAPRPKPDLGQERLEADLAARLPPGAVVVVGCEHGLLNANILSASAARGRHPLTFIHYGHMEGDLWRALSRMVEKDATHLLFVDGLDPRELPPMVPKLDAALRAAVEGGRLPFRRLEAPPGSGGLGYALWERTGPIRMTP